MKFSGGIKWLHSQRMKEFGADKKPGVYCHLMSLEHSVLPFQR